MLPNLVLNDENTSVVEKDGIRGEIQKLKDEGYRLVSITCEGINPEEYEMLYHLDKDYELKNIRVHGKYSETMLSVSEIFPSALLHENEYQDLFGIKFEGLLIDYKGNLYIAENGKENPMR